MVPRKTWKSDSRPGADLDSIEIQPPKKKIMATAKKQGRQWGYVENWNPYLKARVTLECLEDIFGEYESYLPLTQRQIYYRLVGAYGYDNSPKTEDDLQEVLDNARRARRIPFAWVRDDSERGVDVGPVSPDPDDPDEWLEDYLEAIKVGYMYYHVSPGTTQPKQIELWCEAAGMVPQLERVASPYGVAVFSSGGTHKVTANWELAQRVASQPELETIILHIGDFDVDGTDLYEAFANDVTAFVATDEPKATIRFIRVAVTPEQVVAEQLDEATVRRSQHAKRNNARVDRWMAAYGEKTAQAEAIAPNRLAEIVRDAIEEHIDFTVLEAAKEYERQVRAELRQQLLESKSDTGMP